MADTGPKIREAQSGDYEFIVHLMETYLAPYYGGDHRAHADRIFSTHISGGKDNIGHFSSEQKMFIISYDGKIGWNASFGWKASR